MNDSKDTQSVLKSLPWPALLAIAMALVGNLWNQAPLDSQRPKSVPLTETYAGPLSQKGFQAIASSMTEDPFAVYTGPKTECGPESKSSVQKWYQSRIAASEKFIALMVLVPGGMDAVAREDRIRTRYAVEAALARAEFEVRDGKKMLYADIVTQPDLGEAEMAVDEKSRATPRDASLRIPLKLYDEGASSSSRKTHVLVCWINEDRLGRLPLVALSEVAEKLFGSEKDARDKIGTRLQVCILGPFFSSGLERMQKEIRMRSANGGAPAAQGNAGVGNVLFPMAKDIQIVSSRATAALPDWSSDCLTTLLKQQGGQTWRIERTIGTDSLLARALKHELELREAWPTKKPGYVALVHEHDTSYGRGIAKEFKTLVLAKEGAPEKTDNCTAPHRQSLVTYSYLRGIDGRADRADAEKDHEERETAAGAAGSPTRMPEDHSHGVTQYDYLRRLEQEIYEESERRRIRGEGELLAVGVVGTDVYDKLLILRALRGRFPRAIFFTTDLDAEMMQESERRFTRNLIVASHFGLSLRGELQGSIPPFRESYQTSTFLGCLIGLQRCDVLQPALKGLVPTTRIEEAWMDRSNSGGASLAPLVFELGRYRPYQLTMTHWSQGESREDCAWTSAWIHPPSPRDHRIPFCPWWCAMIAVPMSGIMLAYLAGSHHVRSAVNTAFCCPKTWLLLKKFWEILRERIMRVAGSPVGTEGTHLARTAVGSGTPQWKDALAASELSLAMWIGLGVVGSLGWRARSDHFVSTGEPFALFEGISMWPVNFVRLAAGIAAVVCIVLTWRSLKMNAVDLNGSVDLGGDGALRQLVSPDVLGVGARSWFHRPAIAFGGKVIAIALVFFVGIGIVCFKAFGPPSNAYRGEFCESVTNRVLYIVGFAVLVLTLVVVQVVMQMRDALRACGGKAGETHLSNLGTGWSWPWASQSGEDDLRCAVADARNSRRTIRLVAQRTDVVSRIAMYPGVVVLLLLLARYPLFDNLDFPLVLLLAVPVQILFPLLTYVQLRSAADKFREKHLDKLRDAEVAFVAAGKENDAKRIKVYIDEIKAEDEGAFTPWTRDKAFWIVLAPLGGTGAVLVIEKLIAWYPGY